MNNKIEIDHAKIRMAIQSGIPLSVTTYTLPHDMEIYMSEILTAFLQELGQDHMTQYLVYCLNELITNAKKANTKRVFFKEKGLDINNSYDYQRGMESFKSETLNNISHYLELQKKQGLYIQLLLQFRNNKIKLEVHNNSELTVFEYKRIHDKLARAEMFDSIEHALNQILDNSEGAGLGLVIMVLMLKKLGMHSNCFQTICENKETITKIILPISSATNDEIETVNNEFEKSIDDLPHFPENIQKLNRLLSDPNSKLSDIAMQISNDVSLAGELLKHVNSAAFALSKPCSSIPDAVKLIGTRGIQNLLISIETINIFSNISGNSENLWKHAYEVAYFSYNLARNFCASNKKVVEDSYISGLLHDMGKIIFETVHPDFVKKIQGICQTKGIEPELFEKIASGVNHGDIGARIARKWNFPESIINVIQFHHKPENASDENKLLSAVVYTADIMVHFENKEVDFYQINPEILKLLGINSEAQFTSISKKLYDAFLQANA